MSYPGIPDPYGLPGMGTPVSTEENDFLWGPIQAWQQMNVILDASSVDTGHAPQTQIRAGTVLGQVAATQKYKPYYPGATDGSQVPLVILAESRNMLGANGAAEDKQSPALYTAFVRGAKIPNLDENVRRFLNSRFVFDDRLNGSPGDFGSIVDKSASYSVVAADAGTVFTNNGATGTVTFTLPNPAQGLRFEFYAQADQNLIVAAPTGKLVYYNNAAGTSIGFTTAGKRVGGCLVLMADSAGAKYLVKPSLADAAQVLTYG